MKYSSLIEKVGLTEVILTQSVHKEDKGRQSINYLLIPVLKKTSSEELGIRI